MSWYAFLFWLLLLLLLLFLVWECLWVFCNAKISRLQASKSSGNCSSSMQLGDVFILLICTAEAHRIAGYSQQHSYRGVKFSKLSARVFWLYPDPTNTLALVMLFILTEKLPGAKDTHRPGCNRYLLSVIHLPLFSFCSSVIWDIVILCLKQEGKNLLLRPLGQT